MEQLHSNSTFFRKYIFPVLLSTIAIVLLALFIEIEFWIGVVIVFMVSVILIGIFRNFYWDLKSVYLDEPNNRLVISKRNEMISIAFSDIERVELLKILSVVVVVNLRKEIKNMNDFTFVPKQYFLYKSPIVDRLNRLIKFSTAGNTR